MCPKGRNGILNLQKNKIMRTEILFKLKIKGTFYRTGFVADSSADELTLTKFADGTVMLKHGRTTLKDRFSGCKKITDILLNSI
jgi:hypothetical protein